MSPCSVSRLPAERRGPLPPWNRPGGTSTIAGLSSCPTGNTTFYTVRSSLPDNAGIYVGALGSKERIRLLGDESNAAYVAASDGGYLLFVRGETLMAQPFHAGKLQLSGEAFPVVEQLGFNSVFALGAF